MAVTRSHHMRACSSPSSATTFGLALNHRLPSGRIMAWMAVESPRRASPGSDV